MGFFRKKPVVIEARQWNGENYATELEGWLTQDHVALGYNRGSKIVIETLEGPITADKGDWIIKGIKNEFYPCKPDIFEATYEVFNGKTT